ncbi:M16 family metallopeptidase [Xanthomonas campestris]|uniref:M16 family metallopeptidase n=1 Tax=Xanthomonas campestris TaxID=339 RepID=UPI001E39F593|nr:pitrilysin family protein [Xanthomonas campestris]MCC4603059.1 insulinase family protein [Xanthomonas campestris pv. parthenii]
MNRLLHSALPVVLASLLCTTALWPAQAAAPAGAAAVKDIGQVSIDHHVFTLPNGLTVVVHSNHSVPNVFVGVWYRVGSKDEPEGKTGFAHLFEHLMFQETINRKSEYFLPLDKAGGSDMNGITDVDQTRYYQTVPSNALDLALWMESDRMANLGRSITQAGLDAQRAVVQNEKRQDELGQQDPTAQIHRNSYFPLGHPYRHTTIGSMDDLNKASLDDVKAWFAQYYGASNAVLVIAGDVDLATAKQKAAHYFADVPAGTPASHMQRWLPDFPQIKRDYVQGTGAAGGLRRSWPVSGEDPRELARLQLAAGTLAGSPDTILWDLLVDKLHLASSVSANLSNNLLVSTFSIAMTLRPGVTPEQVGPILDRSLADYFAKGPRDAQRIQAIVVGTENNLLRSLQSNAAVGAMLAQGQLYDGDPAGALAQLDWVRTATPEDLRKVASKWLDRPYYEMVIQPALPNAPAPGVVDRSAPPTPGPFTGTVRFPAIVETRLSNGMKLVVAERHGLPLIDASVQFATGTDGEDGYGEGVATQAINLLALGTTQRDASAVSREIARIGFYMNTSIGERNMGLNWSTTSNRVDDSFALAADLLRHPAYPQSEIDRRRANVNIDAAYDAYERNPIESAAQLYAAAVWGPNHRNGRMTTRARAHADFARQNDRAAIARFHDREMGPANATLYVMGDISVAEVTAAAERHFGNWRANTPTALPDPAQDAPPVRSGPRVILVDAPGAPQSSVMAGHLVPALDQDAAATEALMNAALGGSFHSRLNMNLREHKGWTYGFGAGISDAVRGPRVFTASGTVETDKTAAALVEIRKEIRDYVGTRPITPQELERDRGAAIQAIPASFTTSGAVLGAMISARAMGLPYNRAEGAMQRLAAVDLQTVRARARDTYKPEQMTWLVVGDLHRIEADIRALGLGPVEVWDVYGKPLR